FAFLSNPDANPTMFPSSFRPSDFDSLSKSDMLYNNQLAFRIAEQQLSIPALLDPDDMVRGDEPDRRSVALYLSEIYDCFERKRAKRPPPAGSQPSTV